MLEENSSGSRFRTRIIWALLILLVIAIFSVFLSREIVVFWLNLMEFGDLFWKPIYFSMLGGLFLASLALFRVDFKNRRSITWWLLNLIIKIFRLRGDLDRFSPLWLDFDGFRMHPLKFLFWQITKVLVGMFFFGNIMLGMVLNAIMSGWNPHIELLPRLFILPFVTPPMDMAYATENVTPLIPALTLIIPPILHAILIRLVLLVLITHIIRIIIPFVAAYLWSFEMPSPRRFVPAIEMLIAVLLLWLTLNRFFTTFIDYNTRY